MRHWSDWSSFIAAMERPRMRLLPTMQILAVAIAMWTAVVWTSRNYRARMAADSSPGEWRSYRFNRSAMICAAVGVTFFFAWLVTDTAATSWVHALSLPATVTFIAVAAVLSGYAGWVRAR